MVLRETFLNKTCRGKAGVHFCSPGKAHTGRHTRDETISQYCALTFNTNVSLKQR